METMLLQMITLGVLAYIIFILLPQKVTSAFE